MSNIELVIKIPEEYYNDMKNTSCWWSGLKKCVLNGTQLPKGHGDMYDCNDLSKLVDEDFRLFLSRLDLKAPQPIIEAEYEEEVGE